MRVFELQFTTRAFLSEAFARVQELSSVESCTLESDRMSLRFVAPDHDALDLTERIYEGGGLRWCSGSRLE